MIKSTYDTLVSTLESLKFNVITDNHPLQVSLDQLHYPVAILSMDSASGLSETGFVELIFSISFLWPGEPEYNFLASVNQSEAIASKFHSKRYVVTPIEHKTPDVSGGLLRISIKSSLPYICPVPEV